MSRIENAIEIVISKGWDDIYPTGKLLKYAEEELTRLRRIETIAKDVNTWLKQSELRGTAHQRELEKALNE